MMGSGGRTGGGGTRRNKREFNRHHAKMPAFDAASRGSSVDHRDDITDDDAESLVRDRELSIECEEGQMLPEEKTPEQVFDAFEEAITHADPDVHVEKNSDDNFYAYRDVVGGKLVLASTTVISPGVVRLTLGKDLFKAENIHLMSGLATFAAGREFKVKSNDIDHVNALIGSFGKKSLIFDDTDPSKSAFNTKLAAISGIRLLSQEKKIKPHL